MKLRLSKFTIKFLGAFAMAIPALAQLPEHINGELAFEFIAGSDIEEAPAAGEVEMGRVILYGQEELWGDDVFSDEWGLTIAGRGTYTKIDIENVSPGDLNLFALEVPIRLVSEQFERYAFDLGVAPGIYSDLDDFDGDHVNVHGHAAMQYILRPELKVLLGAKYDQGFGEESVYPYLGLKFTTKNKGVEFDFVFPEPRLAFNPSETVQIFFSGKPVGGLWNASESVGAGDESDFEVEYSALQGSGGIAVEVAYDMWIYITGGMEFERELNMDVDKGPEVLDSDLDDAWFARIGFILK